MRIHQIRNATIIVEYNNKRFLVDPMFAKKEAYPPITDKPWPFHDLPLPPKDIVKNIDAVIITHLHIDHFDKYAQDILPKGVNIFVQDIYDKHALEKEHFNNIEVLKPEGTEFEGVMLYKTECRHGVREKAEPLFLANGMRWEAMGVVFKTVYKSAPLEGEVPEGERGVSQNEPTLYLAGDTIWYDGVKDALDVYQPEYIIVNAACAQAGPSGPIIMGVNDIKALHEYYPEGKLIASHMDNVGHATLSRADLRASEVKDYIYAPADGEIMILSK